MSVVDELLERRLRVLDGFERYGEPDVDAILDALPLLLDVVEAAERVSGFYSPHSKTLGIPELRQALAALESAQGAEQRPETGAGTHER